MMGVVSEVVTLAAGGGYRIEVWQLVVGAIVTLLGGTGGLVAIIKVFVLDRGKSKAEASVIMSGADAAARQENRIDIGVVIEQARQQIKDLQSREAQLRDDIQKLHTRLDQVHAKHMGSEIEKARLESEVQSLKAENSRLRIENDKLREGPP